MSKEHTPYQSFSKEELRRYNFNLEMEHAKRIIRDMYGVNTEKSKTMLNKLKQCTNERQIDMTLGWGRRNLL